MKYALIRKYSQMMAYNNNTIYIMGAYRFRRG